MQKRCTAKKMHYFIMYYNFIQQTSQDVLLYFQNENVSSHLKNVGKWLYGKEKLSANTEQPELGSFEYRAALHREFHIVCLNSLLCVASFITETHHSFRIPNSKPPTLQYTTQHLRFSQRCSWRLKIPVMYAMSTGQYKVINLTDQYRLSLPAAIKIWCELGPTR